MKINKFKKFFGYKYIANHSEYSKEVHEIDFTKERLCKIKLIKNGSQITKRKAMKLIYEQGYNGCKFCLPEYHLF